MIEVDRVVKRYGDSLVLNKITLNIPKKGFTAIIGPNGAGKSTLLSIIARLTPADSGKVRIDDLDVTTTSNDLLAKRLAILRQENGNAIRLTIRDLVAFGRYPHSKGRLTAQDANHIEKAISYMGLSELQDRFLDQLSGGQRQRAFVAMILCQDTDYVLLDEPLNNLDMKHAVNMMRLMRSAADDLDKTIIAVLHDINFAAYYADQIIALKDGQLAFMGPPEEIMHQNKLSAIYDMNMPLHNLNGRRIATYFATE